jgi:hypothetical protein
MTGIGFYRQPAFNPFTITMNFCQPYFFMATGSEPGKTASSSDLFRFLRTMVAVPCSYFAYLMPTWLKKPKTCNPLILFGFSPLRLFWPYVEEAHVYFLFILQFRHLEGLSEVTHCNLKKSIE